MLSWLFERIAWRRVGRKRTGRTGLSWPACSGSNSICLAIAPVLPPPAPHNADQPQHRRRQLGPGLAYAQQVAGGGRQHGEQRGEQFVDMFVAPERAVPVARKQPARAVVDEDGGQATQRGQHHDHLLARTVLPQAGQNQQAAHQRDCRHDAIDHLWAIFSRMDGAPAAEQLVQHQHRQHGKYGTISEQQVADGGCGADQKRQPNKPAAKAAVQWRAFPHCQQVQAQHDGEGAGENVNGEVEEVRL